MASLSCLEGFVYPSDRWKVINKGKKNRLYSLDAHSNRVYQRDGWYILSGKAIVLFFILPLITSIGFFINSIRIAIHPFFITICRFIALSKEKFSLCSFSKETIKIILMAERNNFFRLIKAPFYSIALQVICIFSVLFPHQGRNVYAEVEYSWCSGLPKEKDIRHVLIDQFRGLSKRKDIQYVFVLKMQILFKHFFRAVFDYKDNYTFYSAYCFQPQSS